MGQSLSQLYVHLTFGTKNRFPFIKTETEDALHAYMAGVLKNCTSPAICINSVPDHVHILFRLSKNYALAKIIELVKKESSKWIKKQDQGHPNFAWQDGYGAFSVSSSKLDTVKQYIVNQKEHHKKLSYQEEIEQFMQMYEVIDYEPDYFWR